MPKRTDIKKILLLGSGPIVIGQACEFDYSGVQACKALREEGYCVVLVNSNPATVMTDPEMADRTYIEPLTCEVVAKIIEEERPDAVLPTLGGQTALNLAMELSERGILEKYNVEMIAANAEVIAKAEQRDLFQAAMDKIGLECCHGEVVTTLAAAKAVLGEIGLPCVVRPSFTLGGSGSSIAYNRSEFDALVSDGLMQSPVTQVLIEESIIGWKEYEMEVMRDKDDNCVIICSIENFDPMGVHTGDSITVAPAQTLTDKEYQRMRDASLAVIREIGVETGGSNIQFAINPKDGRMIVIEMNPRVSRSSALASKATGFPIAKIAAKLAVGYRLDELPNDITRQTKACFEPAIDYVVTKLPRFTFEKFQDADPSLTTQMKSVGETMAIGRTFRESFHKAARSLEVGCPGFGGYEDDLWGTPQQPPREEVSAKIATPNPERMAHLRYAIKYGMSRTELFFLTKIDPWFLETLFELVAMEEKIRQLSSLEEIDAPAMIEIKQAGFSDRQIAQLLGDGKKESETSVRAYRKKIGITAVFKSVDTCAAEFEAFTPYYYSSYEQENEVPEKPADKKRVMILGGGPNRIGQGIEFDYCCCHASFALRELGIESVMVNSNPETVSTDYDTSDLLFFEPLTTEDVLNICDVVQPDGVIVQFGGQTPLNLARSLADAGIAILGTSVDTIEDAEDREKFSALLTRLGLLQPECGIAKNLEQARELVGKMGFPVLVRPSFVIGGRAMEICYDEPDFEQFVGEALRVSGGDGAVLIDRFLEDATEVDVDAVYDGETVLVAGIMEHIEEAGVHSGDSACVLPPHSLSDAVVEEIRNATILLAKELNVCGLMNVQYAVKEEDGVPTLYVIEVNPRASRTVPFVSKATNVPVAKMACKVMTGKTLKELNCTEMPAPYGVSVKEAVLPFRKFAGCDIVLGAEMRSTGEVMGIGETFPVAFAKSQIAAGTILPYQGKIFVSVSDRCKSRVAPIVKKIAACGYEVLSTPGTAGALIAAGIPVTKLNQVHLGHPNVVDYILNGDVQLIVNTPSGKGARTDEGKIRALATAHGVPCLTTLESAEAAALAMEAMHAQEEPLEVAVAPLQR